MSSTLISLPLRISKESNNSNIEYNFNIYFPNNYNFNDLIYFRISSITYKLTYHCNGYLNESNISNDIPLIDK